MIGALRSWLGNRSILLQLGVAILLCQVVAQGIAVAIVFWRFERPDLLRLTSIQTVEAVTVSRLLSAAEGNESSVVNDLLSRAGIGVSIVPSRTLAATDVGDSGTDHALRGLSMASPELASRARKVTAPQAPDGELRIALDLADGRSIVFDPRIDLRTITLPRAVMTLQVTIAIVSLGLLSLWAVRMLTATVARLAASAERFAVDLDPTPMAEQGPAELRKLAHAFNTMRERLRQHVESRSRMLAAVSHDLRTPLTRMRLRAEAEPDGEDRERTLRDIGMMDRMIGQALSYLRDQASVEAPERVDLATLARTVCDDSADMGKVVTFDGPRNIVIACEADLMTRALSNLVDNAVKFGSQAVVSVGMRSAAEAVIHIRDNGPGILDADKELAFEPFSRGDEARASRGADGFGLGLAIARQIIERHGGRITLHDNYPQGLDVQIVLPVAPALGTPAERTRLQQPRALAAE